MHLQRRVSLVFCAAAMILIACSDMKEMMSFDADLRSEFKVNYLGMREVRSPERVWTMFLTFEQPVDTSEKALAAFARRIGEYIRDRYAGYPKLTNVVVNFAVPRRVVGSISLPETRRTYQFTSNELGQPRVSPQQPAPRVKRAA